MATIPILSKLVDAQEMHRQYPETFDAPSQSDIALIVPDTWVKICRNSERFWVRVIGARGKYLIGEIDSMLVQNPDLQLGQVVRFEPRHLFAIMTKAQITAAAAGRQI
jgi:hypothetical protein